MTTLLTLYARLIIPHRQSWFAIPLRLIVGYGFVEHGYSKLARGPDSFIDILHALGMPMPALLAWATILVELFGGLAVLMGALIQGSRRCRVSGTPAPATAIRLVGQQPQ